MYGTIKWTISPSSWTSYYSNQDIELQYIEAKIIESTIHHVYQEIAVRMGWRGCCRCWWWWPQRGGDTRRQFRQHFPLRTPSNNGWLSICLFVSISASAHQKLIPWAVIDGFRSKLRRRQKNRGKWIPEAKKCDHVVGLSWASRPSSQLLLHQLSLNHEKII
jgi:hypothetical protein